MRQLKPGKYAGHTFTKDQKKARGIWRKALQSEVAIKEGLQLAFNSLTAHSRASLHDRLDKRLNEIERQQKRAKALFADVEESFIISSMTI
ncbi:MAG: hypothetical protein COB10_11125 [Planctomycetota bacterium]|jgi:L-ribulose-5-phosphate 3-epimerase UlaE|nr:MAG: hypothetical protein COB10_11125 [Planctomycetota bacterium]